MVNNILITEQFSTNMVGIDIILPYSEKEHTYLAFLSKLLVLSNAKYPTTKSWMIASEELYNTKVKSGTSIRGKNMVLKLRLHYLTILNEKEEIDALNMLYDVLYNPNVVNNAWNSEDFEDMMNKAKHLIKTYKDNPGTYASGQAMNLLAPNTGLGGLTESEIKEVNGINPVNIYEYYVSLINKVKPQFFAMGQFKIDINKSLNDIFKVEMKPIPLDAIELPINEKPIRKLERLHNQQTILKLGFKFDNLTDFESKYVKPIFNDLFGGSIGMGKLFKKIREEQGFAYYVYSKPIVFTNLLTVTAGIKEERIDDVIDLVNESLKELKQGHFEEQYINEIIDIYEVELNATYDHKVDLFNQMIKEYNQIIDAIDLKIANYKKVTKADIIKLADKLKLATIYILAGDK